MIRFLDLTTRRFDGGASSKVGHLISDAATREGAGKAGELKARVPVFVLTVLWLAASIAFFGLIFIAMFL